MSISGIVEYPLGGHFEWSLAVDGESLLSMKPMSSFTLPAFNDLLLHEPRSTPQCSSTVSESTRPGIVQSSPIRLGADRQI